MGDVGFLFLSFGVGFVYTTFFTGVSFVVLKDTKYDMVHIDF